MSDDEEQYILFLKGIYINDYIDIDEMFKNKLINSNDNFDDNIKCNCSIQKYKKINYDKIPTTFDSLKTWKRSTNLKCWNCDLTFKNIPIFIPKHIYNTRNGKRMDILGNFCSFGCAKGFIDSNKKITKDETWDQNERLKILYNIFYKKHINDIKPSPDKYNLIYYGGKLEVREYKEQILNVNKLNS